MHLSFAVFADAANLSQEGKLNILGVFDALQVGGFPAVHPRATLVVRLKGGRPDAGTHSVRMQWLNPRGQELWSSVGQIDIAVPPNDVVELDLPLIAQIDLPLDGPGRYQMTVSVDDQIATELALHVRHVAGPVPMQPAPRGLVS
jgi:hypothetical protein